MEKMNSRLSKATIGFGAYIVISAAFMLQVRNWLFGVFGAFLVVNCFRSFFILVAVSTTLSAYRRRLGLFKVCAAFSIFVLAYLFAMWQPYFTEKTHVLTYGLLGYLAAGDLVSARRKRQLKNIILAAAFVSLTSALDEIFQRILPYRVGEVRDFITNIISGSFGIGLLLIFKTEKKKGDAPQ